MKRIFILLLSIVTTCPMFAQDNAAMIKAAFGGDLETVKKNVEGNGNVNFINDQGQTAISVAYLWPEITSYLISKGADVNGGTYPALVAAPRNYSVEVMRMLLKAGADPSKVAEVKVDVAAPVRKMLEEEKAKGKKANKYLVKAYEDQLSKMGNVQSLTFTALQNTVSYTNCTECLAMLLNAGAKPEYKSAITGGNLLHELAMSYVPADERNAAIQASLPYFEKAGMALPEWYKNIDVTGYGNAFDMAKLLKDKGVNIEAVDNNKWTPLKVAVSQPKIREEVVMALIGNGADFKSTGLNNDPTDFQKETADGEKVKVRFDFPAEGRHSSGSGYSANMELVNPKPKKVALISYYLYDPGKGKTKNTGNTISASVWRTPNGVGQTQVDGFYSKSIEPLKASFKENGIDLLTPEEFLDTDEKVEFYFGFNQESAKKEKTEITKRRAGGYYTQVVTASVENLKVAPTGKGYRNFFIANESDDESMIANFQGGVFSANRKLTSSLGYELAKGLGVDAVVVVYICTRKLKENVDDFGVNAVVTMMLGPNPGRNAEGDPDAKNLGQFYCGTRTFYGSPLIFKDNKGVFGQYDGMGNILKAHAAKMSKYINGKEKEEE
jgi:ankyrin repeat protein